MYEMYIHRLLRAKYIAISFNQDTLMNSTLPR